MPESHSRIAANSLSRRGFSANARQSTELHEKATTRIAADFLHALIKAVPYQVHTVLTDNGTHFTDPRGETCGPAEIRQILESKEPFWAHAFEYACARTDVDHRVKPKHPWTNGQVERMNRTIKDATVKRFYYETQLRCHLADFVSACNFAKRLKTLKGLMPLRVHLQGLDKRAGAIHPQSAPANARTKHLGGRSVCR
jgi:transposase InsO family protein